jgi:hypothetical protein
VPTQAIIMPASYLRVIKVNEVRKGVSSVTRKPYEMQDASCIVLDELGQVVTVGLFMVPKDLTGHLVPGDYACGFGLGVDREGKISARIASLSPVKMDNGKATLLPPLKVA